MRKSALKKTFHVLRSDLGLLAKTLRFPSRLEVKPRIQQVKTLLLFAESVPMLTGL